MENTINRTENMVISAENLAELMNSNRIDVDNVSDTFETDGKLYHVEVKRLYTYAELTGKAKEKARNWFFEDDARTYMFEEDCQTYLAEKFPSSELDVQFSLSYCQGDGVNIYGRVWLSDIVKVLNFDGFTEKEKRFILWAVNEYDLGVKIPQNWRYCYCIARQADFGAELAEELEYHNMRGINEKALEKFDNACVELFDDICGEFETNGYDYLYPDDDTIAEECAANEWYFDKNGNMETRW